jgi:hypothetical protein
MSTLYLKGIEQAYKAGIDVATDTFRLSFMATTYTPDAVNEEYFDDISASVASGTTARTLVSPTFTINGANLRCVFDAGNVSEASVTTNTNKVVIYKWTGVASTSVLIACIDITEGTLSPINGILALNFSASGIFGIKTTE